MFARLSLCVVVLSGCAPVLELRRLSTPAAVLGSARTVRVEVTSSPLDELPGEPERVSELTRRLISDRVKAAGYDVCSAPQCGDGVLEVRLEELAVGAASTMQHRPSLAAMDEAMKLVRNQRGATQPPAPAAEQVQVDFRLRVTLVQADGAVGFRLRQTNTSRSNRGTAAEVLRASLEGVAKDLGESLSRQAPVVKVPLEGGGPLDRGVELLHAADWAGAVAHFTQVTRAHPELAGAWYDLGVALEAQRSWRAALEAYEAAMQRAPTPHFQAAAAALRKALAVPPE